MKLFIRLIIIFLLALAVAGFSKFNTGGVVIDLFQYQIQLSLNLLLVIWLISFIILYYVLRLVINLHRLPNKLLRARTRRGLILSRKNLNLAGLYYFEGRFRNCYDNAIRSIKYELNQNNKFLAYMLAFRSASMMKDRIKETKISAEIEQFSEPKWQLAKCMIIAENLYNEQQFGQCIDNLQAALQIDAKHIPARRMLLKVYLYLANYQQAYEVLTWLLKNDSLREYKASRYSARVFSGLFAEINDVAELTKIYQKLNRDDRSSFLFGKLYFGALLRIKEYRLAIDFLSDHSKDDNLQLIYRDAILALANKIDNVEDAGKLLVLAEKCLIANRNSSEILLALGILSYRKQLWGKAKSYLESSLSISKTLDGYVYLAFVAESTNDEDLFNSTQKNILSNIQNFK